MGWYYYVTCRNKACRYSVKIYGGGGIKVSEKEEKLEEEILTGKRAASEKMKELMQSGEPIEFRTTYLCPQCHEWQVADTFYIFEAVHVSPYGTIREYKLHYLEGEPVSEKCGGHLIHILNPRSSKNPVRNAAPIICGLVQKMKKWEPGKRIDCGRPMK